MSVVLIVEQDSSYSQRIAEALEPEGFAIETCEDPDTARRIAAEAVPRLVIASASLPDVRSFLDGFSRARGGPGAIVLIPTTLVGRVSAADYHADDILAKPFTTQELKDVVGTFLPEVASSPDLSWPPRMSSVEIFGDVLEEVEAEAKRRTASGPLAAPVPSTAPGAPKAPPPPAAAPAPAPQEPASAPPPVGGAPPAVAPRRRPESSEDIDRRLEETLSGVLPLVVPKKDPGASPAKRTARSVSSSASEIDELLDRTLSSLELPIRKKPRKTSPPVEKPAAEAGPAAAPVQGPEPLATLDIPIGDLPELPELPELEAPELAAPALEEAPAEEPSIEAVALRDSAGSPEQEEAIEFFPGSVSFEAGPEIPAAVEAADAPAAAEEEEAIKFFPGNGSIEEEGEPVEEVSGPGADEPAAEEEAIEFFPSTPATFVDLPVAGASLPEGEAFGDYTLLRKIAVGGMAEVWQARRRGVEGFQKTVAIKKILPHLTHSQDFVTMFIDEAKLAAQLNHNNIIQIYDLGKEGEDFFIAMEYVDGLDLRTILNKARGTHRPLPMGQALLIASCLARALDYAHRKRDFDNRALGLVHRDVSPQNVLISYEGEIKLCDFGIVKAVAKASQTQMGALKGKLQYMSPEQAWGKSVDARSDIFSLGAVLFEVLTDTRLFTGESELGVLDAVRECRTRAPREIAPEIPEEVDRIVRRALARTPEERYQTAGEMEEELKTVLFNLKPMPSQSELATYMSLLAVAPEAEAPVEVPLSLATPAADEAPTPLLATPAPLEDFDEVPAFFPEATDEIAKVAEAVAAPEPAAAKGAGGPGKKLLIAAFLIVVIAVAVYFAWAVLRPADDTPPAGEPAPTAPAAADESVAAEDGKAGEEAVAEPLPLDVQELIDKELEKRAEATRQEFEEKKRRLEAEIAAQKAATGQAADELPTDEKKKGEGGGDR